LAIRQGHHQEGSLRTPFVASLLIAIAIAAANTQVLADEHGHEHDNHHCVHHKDWRKGAKIHDEVGGIAGQLSA
jgi:hypothetical protein